MMMMMMMMVVVVVMMVMMVMTMVHSDIAFGSFKHPSTCLFRPQSQYTPYHSNVQGASENIRVIESSSFRIVKI